jgi:hypothetical protein
MNMVRKLYFRELSLPKQDLIGINAVNHELVLTTELIAAGTISLQHVLLLGERVQFGTTTISQYVESKSQ